MFSLNKTNNRSVTTIAPTSKDRFKTKSLRYNRIFKTISADKNSGK